jgi:hypothetical protein
MTRANVISATEAEAYTRRERNLHLALVLLAAAVLLLLILFAPRDDGGFTLAGTYISADSPKMTQVFLASLFIAFPLIAAVIAIVAAVYPFRDLPWKRKYLRAFLLSLFGVYTLNILLFSLIAISS